MIAQLPPVWLIQLFVVLLGLVVGSFTNVLIARIPAGESIAWPGSRCPKCHHPVGWRDNVPVLSWLLLRGRCRWCRLPISVRYPVVELLSALLYLAAYRKFGLSWLLFVRDLPFLTGLLAITFIDLDHRIIPNRLSLGLLVLGLGTAHWVPGLGLAEAATGAAAGFLGFYFLAVGYARATGKMGLGGGDVKLLAAIGAFLGAWGVLGTVLVSSVVGSLVGIGWGLLSGRRNVMGLAIPYGPFLVMGALCYFLLGGEQWLRSMIPM